VKGLVKRSFSLAGHRTSVALEAEFWEQLSHLAAARGVTLVRLVAELDAARAADQPLASTLRVFVVRKLTGS
jgi:predicted DNA-binding ribbon-helix-helix protein